MNEKTKKTYEVPQMTEFECRVEKGFTGSGLGNGEGEGSKTLEGRRNAGGWGENGAIWT